MRKAEQTVPDWAIGCMDREYIILDGGPKDPSVAIWIQTESVFFDFRKPHDRPAFEDHRSLGDFSADDLMQLARQSGDVGICSIEDNVATWKGWQDRFGFFSDDMTVFPDDGRLDPRGDVIYEYDTPKSAVAYEEAWVKQPLDGGLFAHLTLRAESDSNDVLAVLLVADRYAGYVEKSTSDNSASLEAQLKDAAGDVGQMREILACEASYAIRSDANAPYVVRHSNLPFREGAALDVPEFDAGTLERTETLPSRRGASWWRIESWFDGN